LGWYASIAQRSSDELVYLAPAELGQAEIYDHQGDRAQAAEHYRRFVQVWPAPESELVPVIESAHSRLAELGGTVGDR
jgi:hypothetical protein